MRANDDTPAGEKNGSGTDDTNERGATGTTTATLEDVYASVDAPERTRDDASLGVKGYAFDDEPGTVVLGVGNGVSTTVVLDVAQARDLADAIAEAADAAEAEVDSE